MRELETFQDTRYFEGFNRIYELKLSKRYRNGQSRQKLFG